MGGYQTCYDSLGQNCQTSLFQACRLFESVGTLLYLQHRREIANKAGTQGLVLRAAEAALLQAIMNLLVCRCEESLKEDRYCWYT